MFEEFLPESFHIDLPPSKENYDETVFVYLSNNPEPRQVPWEDYAEITDSLKGEARDVLSGGTVDLTSLTAEPKSAMVIEIK